MCKHLPNAFPIQSNLKQGDALLLLFSFSLERKVKGNQVGLELNDLYG
jgi:hypothetical protein